MSSRRRSRYSAREVNIRYGSCAPLVTRSSISTPMYASDLPRMTGSAPTTLRAALIPATIPWAAASSYPLVPLICPAWKRFSTILVSRDGWSWTGSTKSYSMAYPGRTISTASRPGIVRSILTWMS